MQTYQRITQNMFRYMPKYASITFNLNANHQIKSAVYKKINEKIFNNIIWIFTNYLKCKFRELYGSFDESI